MRFSKDFRDGNWNRLRLASRAIARIQHANNVLDVILLPIQGITNGRAQVRVSTKAAQNRMVQSRGAAKRTSTTQAE